jgi:hypothetical protein
MSTYEEVVKTTKKFQTNVVILIDGNYFAIRQPDSGLSISTPYDKLVLSLLLNPTQMDLQKVTTTISSFSFKLLDKDGVISALVGGDASNLIGQETRIFLGRSNEDMAFADYYELPRTYIKKLDHSDNAYNFSSTEQTERMAKPIYDFVSALGANLLVGTTIWTMRDDISTFPASGFLKVDDEFVSYSGVDLVNNRFTGVIRGELNSIVAEHDINTDVMFVETVTANPIDIILQLLTSGGGGGAYDVLEDGLGISNTLIDITGIEALRDELFETHEYTLSLYNIPSALKFIEDQLLMPNNLRFTTEGEKVTLAVLDKARFVEEDDIIDHDTITKFPKWSIDGAKVVNVIEVNWDYSEGINQYQERTTYEDAASITAYERQTPLVFNFKGLKSALDGQALADDFGSKLLARLSLPTPLVEVNTHLDKSLQTIGDKAYLVSNKIPAADGTLEFASNLEIVSRAINLTNGDVQFKLAFTSFTNIRSGFIAPSDLISVVNSQSSVDVGAGRGAYYRVGWVMRLFLESGRTYESDPVNTILSITGDTIVFEDAWATTLTTGHRLRFADYDSAAESQKRYCFISNLGNNFDDGKQTYKVTY